MANDVTVRQKLQIDLANVLKEGDIADPEWAEDMAITIGQTVERTLMLTEDMMNINYQELIDIQNQMGT